MEMFTKLTQAISSFKKNSAIFAEYFFMMLGVGIALLLTLKILTWLF